VTVKDALFEQISALADGELAPRERALLLRRLETDIELRDRWTRYHQIGELLRGGAVLRNSGLADRVSDAISEDTTQAAGRPRPAWVRPLAGLAVAASVTFVAVLAIRTPQLETNLSPVASAPLVAPTDSEVSIRAAALRSDDERERLRRRMEAYLINYTESAAATRPQGLLEFVHVARQGDLAQPGSEEPDAVPVDTADEPD
jgi:sigma-E factor negative regulatory protein RseA